jgi:hypothetical protein
MLSRVAALVCLYDPRFNLSTAGWTAVATGSPPLQFMFLANYHRGSPVPLSDLGPGPGLHGLLLPLSLTDANGTVEITVLAHDSDGCDTIVSPSVVVTVVPPSLANLAEQYAGNSGLSGPNIGSTSSFNVTSSACLRCTKSAKSGWTDCCLVVVWGC